MRKRYFINPALVLMALLPLATSCELFDLDENPRSFTAPETYYNTPAQIETVISGTMSRSYRSWGANYAYNPGFHRHDDQNAGGNLVITMNYASDIWSLHWANIKDLNFAIAAMVEGKVEGAAPGQEEQLMGMLKFHRAWNYFQLVRHWGGLPLLTEADVPNYFVTMPARATVAQVYELIVADFTEAIAKLPEDWGELAGRPARDAARGLLAKAYLTMATAPLNDESNYARAAAMAREVIDGGRHSLVEDITKVFSMETKYGPEAIWSFNANGEARSTDPHIWSSLEGWGDYSCDKDWAELVFPDQPRREAYLELTNRDGVGYLELGQGIGIKKFMYDTWENFDNGITTISIPIIRYADVLLIFAEADNMANGGPTPAALEAVNSVIDRANGYEPNPAYPLLTAAMSRDEFDRAVVAERGFELCFEYDRWCDIVRKRILGEVTNEDYMPNYTDADYLYPIPEVETRLNDNMEQNPGYSS